MSGSVNVAGILERAGADPNAPEGSQGWALAQVDASVAKLIKADKEYDEALRLANVGYGSTDEDRAAQQRLREAVAARRAALARVQGGAA